MGGTTISDPTVLKKASMVAETKTWQYFLFSDPGTAVGFANEDPAQGAGEADFSVREDGQTDTFLYF